MKAYLITTIFLYCSGIVQNISETGKSDRARKVTILATLVQITLTIWATLLYSKL
jgi:hypothetical protein